MPDRSPDDMVLVPSLTTRGRTYEVTLRDGEPVGCQCVRASFLKRGESCTHMDLARRVKTLEQKCIAAHGRSTSDGICCDCLAAVLALSAQHVRAAYVTKIAAKEKVAKARQRRTRKPKRTIDVACPGRHDVGCDCQSCAAGHVNCGLGLGENENQSN